jgi:hypothetical protein
MFCRLGFSDDRRPVAAMIWLKVVWMRPSSAISLIRPSTVVRSLVWSRCLSMIVGSSWSVWVASQASWSASVL